MQRYFIELQYKGTDFFGWQRQPNEISVQEVIEDVLTRLNSNDVIKVVGCGRTDTGVHAHHFILHVDNVDKIDVDYHLRKMNMMLPPSISINRIFEVENDKHARFNATSRTYRYFITKNKDPFNSERCWLIQKELNFEMMNEAAKCLLGEHDFTSLSKKHTDVKTNICTITKAEWGCNEDEVYFEIISNRFLRNMVRATVGTLINVGIGKLSVQGFKDILDQQDRQAAAISAPAHGLFLWKVNY